jgi:FkbM family methyltransferase
MKIEGDLAFRLRWALLSPLRAYVRYSPLQRGRPFLMWRVLGALVPDRTFLAHVRGGKVRLRCREVVGFLRLVQGSFEEAEIETLSKAACPGTVAIDAGAHVGLFTIPFSRAVGPEGEVWAFEPLPENVERLRANVQENRLRNVATFAAAASDADGVLPFRLAGDSAYGSTVEVRDDWETGKSMNVRAVSLDTEWKARGMPPVTALKVDVEGAELRVLRGSRQLLRRYRPPVLVEVTDPDELERIASYLAPLAYEERSEGGFAPHNHLFTVSAEATTDPSE